MKQKKLNTGVISTLDKKGNVIHVYSPYVKNDAEFTLIEHLKTKLKKLFTIKKNKI